MQGHEASEIIAAMALCTAIAVAIILVMLSALLTSANTARRRKWMPRYIFINSILAIIFCGVIIFTQSQISFLSVCKLLFIVLIIALWAAAATREKWCKKCGEILVEDSAGERKWWLISPKKTCPSCGETTAT